MIGASHRPRLGKGRPRGLREPAPNPPRRSGEPQVRHHGEARLILPQREQEMRDPIAGRKAVRLRHAHTPAIHPPPARAHQQRSALADQPDAKPPRCTASPVRRSRSRSRWPTRSARSPSETPSAAGSAAGPPRSLPSGTTERAPRRASSHGTIQACAKHPSATGSVNGDSRSSPIPGAVNRTTIEAVQAVQRRPSRRSESPVTSSRHHSAAASASPGRRGVPGGAGGAFSRPCSNELAR